MSVQYTIVSIGTLSRNRFWNETEAKRTAHATTTLVRDGTQTILVDPGLPGDLLTHLLDERTGLRPDQIDVVFLTNFRPVHRRGLALFEKATWLMHEPEIDAVRDHLAALAETTEAQRPEVARLLQDERNLLQRIAPADEKLTPAVHLFPSIGPTPGSAALLLAGARTVVVAGDAVVTRDYYEAGRIFEQVADLNAAQEAYREIAEIADEIVPGHDNSFPVVGR
jgi:glyoxylase-like metal-dependent hydrolase (beta-lactamase superfamily II)